MATAAEALCNMAAVKCSCFVQKERFVQARALAILHAAGSWMLEKLICNAYVWTYAQQPTDGVKARRFTYRFVPRLRCNLRTRLLRMQSPV